MEKHILNQDRRTFLISLKYKSTDKKFIFQAGEELKYILETYDNQKKGIEFIKVFDGSKNNFVKITNAEILNFFSWDTETSIYLEDHYYFKK